MISRKGLHRFAVFAALCTFCLVIAGGLVTSTGSSLAVPDWPLAYGMVMPPMVGGILYEHGHRMVATFVGMLTVILAVWLWRKEERRWLKILGIVALGAVITQGLLGGLTVVLLLPTAISVLHAMLAQSFFAVIAAIALFTSRWWKLEHPTLSRETGSSFLRLSIVTTAAVFAQLILGAIMRHTGSGLVVPDFPLAYGQIFPSLSPESLARYNHELIYSDIRLFADGAVTSSQIVVHMAHRIWALVVAILALALSTKLLRANGFPRRVRLFGYTLGGLTLIQLLLGASTVLSRKGIEVSTAHVAVGALILVVSVLLSLHVVRMCGVRLSRFSAVYTTERVLV